VEEKMMRWRIATSASVLAALAAAGSVSAGTNLVVNGNFKDGNTGFSTGYTLTTMTPYLFQNGVHGIYTVEPAASIASSSAYGDWTNITTNPQGTKGKVYVADGATSTGTVVWSETVTVTPNTKYRFSFDGAEVSNACCSNAMLSASVNGVVGTVLTTSATWQRRSFVWKSGSTTTATLTVIDTNTEGPYNDFAIDDFSFEAVDK
jgi:hypothetical protein